MFTLGHHNKMYPEYTRYNEYSYYIGSSQQCIPWVIKTVCIQSTQVIMNTISILIGHSNVYPGSSKQCLSRDSQGIMNTVST